MTVDYCCLCSVSRKLSRRFDLGLRFFSLPNPHLYAQQHSAWLAVIGRTPKQGQGICSRHFESGFPSNLPGSSDFVPSASFRVSGKVDSIAKRKNDSEACCLKSKEARIDLGLGTLVDSSAAKAELERMNREIIQLNSSAKKLREENLDLKQCLIEAQNTRKLLPENFLDNDDDFRALTNLAPEIFKGLYRYLSKDLIALPQWHSKLSESKPGRTCSSRFSSRESRLSPMQELFVTLVRLRVGLTLKFLSINLELEEQYLCSIFIKVVNIMAIKLEQMCPLVVDPEAQKLLFPRFFEHFPYAVLLGDCTEITIEKSANIGFNKNNYSHHKGRNTCKLLVLATYGGSVRFCSHSWGGKISDQALVRRERIKDRLLAETKGKKIGIIFDRGFPNLELEFAEANIQVITPAFRGRGGNLSFEDTVRSKLIAHYRIQIERVNTAIKTFRILQRPFPLSMLYSMEPVTKCCAFLTNLMNPVIKPKADMNRMVSELLALDSSEQRL